MKITVSGSFNKYLDSVRDISEMLRKMGHTVLSPGNTKIVDCKGQFLFIESDESRDIREVEGKHLEAIRMSDFLWVVTKNHNHSGHVGRSVSFEIGYAVSHGTPVYTDGHIPDPMLREYVTRVENIDYAIAEMVQWNSSLGKEV